MARRIPDLNAFYYAHRGFWTKGGAPENSLAAFRAAAAAGYGIEFDVRPSADGEIMVYHDATLERLTPRRDRFDQLTASDLQALSLAGGPEHVPTFEQLLDLWPPHLPLLTEIKVDGGAAAAALAAKVGARLSAYKGLAAAMSFSEAAVDALPKDLMRGQLIYPSGLTGQLAFKRRVMRAMRRDVDYLSVHVSDAGAARDILTGGSKPLVTWTVRDQAAFDLNDAAGTAIIFDTMPAPRPKSSAT